MDEAEGRPSLPARIGFGFALAAALVVALYALLHVSVRPINPKQETPRQHFTIECSLCHTVSEKARLVRE